MDERRVGRGGWTLDVIRIRPHEVAVGALVRNFLDSFQNLHLVDGTQCWGETSVDTQHPPVNHRSEIQIIKDLHAVLPGVSIPVLAHALLEEAVDLSDLSRLVVAAQEGHVGRVSRLETEQQLEGFHAVVSAIDKVSLKQKDSEIKEERDREVP
jgi:hypothetical protein